MSLTLSAAKWMMGLMPNKPRYVDGYFQQEYFRHPDFLALDENSKKVRMIEFVKNDYERGCDKCFEDYFPGFPFADAFRGKTILDIGCSIGGKSIYNAEKWSVRAMHGIDVSEPSVESARLFLATHAATGIEYDFRCAVAEDLPFADAFFDAIVTSDTLEHVRDVERTLRECKRVTKPGGQLFIVFPAYQFPFGGAHVGSATRTPFLEWFFRPETLNRAYQEIVATWDDEERWFLPENESSMDGWARVKGGIGINGIDSKGFDRIVSRVGFSDVRFLPTPLLSVGNTASRHALIRHASRLLRPMLRVPAAVNYLSHRLVYTLTV